MQLQDRDYALLCGLFECRVMTADHIAALFFDGKREYTKKRLQKLKAAGFISERRRRVNQPAIYFLTRKALTELKAKEHLAQFPSLGTNSFEARADVSELTLRHELEIMDVKTAFHVALAKSDKFSISDFSTWPLLNQFETSRPGCGGDVLIKPDGFIRIHEPEEGTKGYMHDCFLEVDRSSEGQDTLINKAVCYLEYYRSGGFAVRNGAARTEVVDFPFRVLIVMNSAERRNNTAERLVHNIPPIFTQVWITTLAEVTADPLGAIWIQPADFRDATVGTPFYDEHPAARPVYRRQAEREAYVEAKMKKRRLLES